MCRRRYQQQYLTLRILQSVLVGGPTTDWAPQCDQAATVTRDMCCIVLRQLPELWIIRGPIAFKRRGATSLHCGTCSGSTDDAEALSHSQTATINQTTRAFVLDLPVKTSNAPVEPLTINRISTTDSHKGRSVYMGTAQPGRP